MTPFLNLQSLFDPALVAFGTPFAQAESDVQSGGADHG